MMVCCIAFATLALAATPDTAGVDTAAVAIAARPLRAREILSDADIEIDGNTELADATASAIVGRETVRAIRQGAVITALDLRAPTLVRRNAVVRLEFAKGAL